MITTNKDKQQQILDKIQERTNDQFYKNLAASIKGILREGKVDHDELKGNDKDLHTQYYNAERLSPIVDKIIAGIDKFKIKIVSLSETQEIYQKKNEKKSIELQDRIEKLKTILNSKDVELDEELQNLKSRVQLTEKLTSKNAEINLQERKNLELAEDQINRIYTVLNRYLQKSELSQYIDLKGKGVEIKKTVKNNKIIFEITSKNNGNGGGFHIFSSGGAKLFSELGDVPSTYAGQQGKVVAVNPTATGLIFTSAGSGSGDMVGATYDPNGIGKDVFNTDNHTEGNSNFFWKTSRIVGAGGASISVNGKTATIYSKKTNLLVNGLSIGNRTNLEFGTTIGGIILLAVDDPTNDKMQVLIEQDKLVVNGFSNGEIPFVMHDPTSGLDYLYYDSNLKWGSTDAKLTIAGSIDLTSGGRYYLGGTYINTDNVNEGLSNFYYKPTRLVGTGGASVSVNGLTLTIYSSVSGGGASLSDNLGEGISNFYWRSDRLVGSNGASVISNGKTVTIYGFYDDVTVTIGMDQNSDYICDGVSDDIQFIAALSGISAGTILVKNGEFFLNSGLSWSKPVKMVGMGKQSTKLNFVTTSGDGIHLGDGAVNTNINHGGVEDLSIKTTRTGSSGYGLYNSMNFSSIKRILVDDKWEHGVHIINDIGSFYEDIEVQDPSLSDPRPKEINIGVYANNVWDIKLKNITTRGCFGGIQIEGAGQRPVIEGADVGYNSSGVSLGREVGSFGIQVNVEAPTLKNCWIENVANGVIDNDCRAITAEGVYFAGCSYNWRYLETRTQPTNMSQANDDNRKGWLYVEPYEYNIATHWTYVSGTQFTVIGDKTTLYRVGTKLRVLQTTNKYFKVTASSYSAGTDLTTVTINGDGVYTYLNASVYAWYSYDEYPSGWDIYKGTANTVLHGNATSGLESYSTIGETDITLNDNTLLDFGTSKHGLVPKGLNQGKYLKDDGTWAAVAGASGVNSTDDVPEGTSNFYWRTDRITASYGCSAVPNGLTLSIYGNNSKVLTSGRIPYITTNGQFTDSDTFQLGLSFDLLIGQCGDSAFGKLGIGSTPPSYATMSIKGLNSGSIQINVGASEMALFGAVGASNQLAVKSIPGDVIFRGTQTGPRVIFATGKTGIVNLMAEEGTNYVSIGSLDAQYRAKALLHLAGLSTATYNYPLIIDNGATTMIFQFLSDGRMGVGVSPTALLHLKAGTSTLNYKPLKFTSGALGITPEAGSVEFLTDKFYGTVTTGPSRMEFTLNDQSLTAGRIPIVTTNGRLYDLPDIAYSAANQQFLIGAVGVSCYGKFGLGASVPSYNTMEIGSLSNPSIGLRVGDTEIALFGAVGSSGALGTGSMPGDIVFRGTKPTKRVLFATSTTGVVNLLAEADTNNVAIGSLTGNYFPKARLEVKTGSAGTSAAFVILNTNGITMFGIRDDGQITMGLSADFVLDINRGSRLGLSSNQRFGLWGTSPTKQPTTSVTVADIVTGTSTAVTADMTFDGYTIAQVVKALRSIGVLA